MIKITRIITLAIVLLALGMSSCKKEAATDSKYYVKFKKNGTWITWTYALGELGPDLIDDSKTNLGIVGYTENGKGQINLSIQVDGPVLGTGVYNSDDYFIPIIYAENALESDLYLMGDIDGREESKYTITITSITDDSISGHFSGNYLTKSFEENDVVEITEGQFVAKRVR